MMAFGGQQAWEMIQQGQARFLVTDWTMPDLDGLQLIRMIRSASLPGYTYIILLTGRDQPRDIVFGLEAGADDYLTKPFNPLELQARVAVGERILKLEQSLIETRDQLQHQAMHDGLTNLLNRRALYDLAQVELERARRHSSPFGLIFLDVDNLKHINDHYGHQFGDITLKAVANIFRENSRPYDGVGRWAGDEFMIALPEATTSNAVKITERILQGIDNLRLVTPNGESLTIGASAGVAVISQVDINSKTLDALVESADEALYRAKHAGRGQLKLNRL
jgi:two-component system chemotaxis response regulator CheY